MIVDILVNILVDKFVDMIEIKWYEQWFYLLRPSWSWQYCSLLGDLMVWMLCSACLRHYQRILGAPTARMLAPSNDDDDDGDDDCTGQVLLYHYCKWKSLRYLNTYRPGQRRRIPSRTAPTREHKFGVGHLRALWLIVDQRISFILQDISSFITHNCSGLQSSSSVVIRSPGNFNKGTAILLLIFLWHLDFSHCTFTFFKINCKSNM